MYLRKLVIFSTLKSDLFRKNFTLTHQLTHILSYEQRHLRPCQK